MSDSSDLENKVEKCSALREKLNNVLDQSANSTRAEIDRLQIKPELHVIETLLESKYEKFYMKNIIGQDKEISEYFQSLKELKKMLKEKHKKEKK